MDSHNDLVCVVQTIKELEDSRNEYMCENEKLLKVILELENDADKTEQLNRDDIQLIDEQETAIQNLQKDIKTLHAAVQKKDMEIAQLKGCYKDLEELIRENDNILKDIQHCEHRTAKLKVELMKLEGKDDNDTIARQENQMSRLQMTIAEYQKTIEALTADYDCLVKRNEECRKRVEEAIMENEHLLDKTKQYENSRHKLEECNNKLMTLSKQLKNKLAKETATGVQLDKKLSVLEDENDRVKNEISHLRDEINGINEEIDEEQSELDKCRAELKRKHQEFENYKNTISSLRDKIMSNRSMQHDCNKMRHDKSRTRRSRYQFKPVSLLCGKRSNPYKKRYLGGDEDEGCRVRESRSRRRRSGNYRHTDCKNRMHFQL